MRTYELVLIVRPIQEAARKKVIDAVKTWLKGLKTTEEKDWGSKALKYKIKKELTGFYYSFNLEGDMIPDGIETRLQNTDEILRHLIIRTK